MHDPAERLRQVMWTACLAVLVVVLVGAVVVMSGGPAR